MGRRGMSRQADSPIADAGASRRLANQLAILDLYKELLRNWDIAIRARELPEFRHYIELRDRLALMHPVRRWLSWRLRRELKERRARAKGALLDGALGLAEERERGLAKPDR